MNRTIRALAHGRVNLIGEHTDYNGGWVLPTAISQYTEVAMIKRDDNLIVLSSGIEPHTGNLREFTYEIGQELPTGTWVDYLQGATKILAEFLQEQKFTGFFASIHSTIPEGSGLSSSAALEVSFLKAIRETFELKMTDIDIALLGQRVENEFVGAKVGIMDQMATCLAQSGEALYLDTKELTYENITLPYDQFDLLIINSGVSHRLSEGDGGYNTRRKQCEEACQILGINQLRDITLDELKDKDLPKVLMKRARHVVSENARVHLAVKAIKSRDFKELGKLFNESHASMKNDYEVSVPEIDTLVELCQKDSRVYGARLTGGGFGGSIVAITQKDASVDIGEAIVKKYQEITKLKAVILS